MAFHDKMSVSVDTENKKVRLSVKLNDDVVVVIEGSISDFDFLIAQYEAAKQS